MPPGEQATGDGKRGPWRLVLVAGLVLLLAAGGLLWWLRSGDEPAEVDLARDEALDEDADPDGDADPDDLDGRWQVDLEVEPFDREAGTGTFVGYRVDEELTTVGAFTAVGRTPLVDGEVEVIDGSVTSASIDADLTGLESDSGRRDGRVLSTLGGDPRASFTLTDGFDLPAGLDAEPVTVTATGELTILEVTETVELELQAAIRDSSPVIAGRIEVLLSDYGVDVPSAPIVVSASDEAVLEWQLFLARG